MPLLLCCEEEEGEETTATPLLATTCTPRRDETLTLLRACCYSLSLSLCVFHLPVLLFPMEAGQGRAGQGGGGRMEGGDRLEMRGWGREERGEEELGMH